MKDSFSDDAIDTAGWAGGLYAGEPYTSGEQPKAQCVAKLNTNENPYPPAPGVSRALAGLADAVGALRLYPPADGGALRAAIAEYHGVGVANVCVCNGSDEALAFAFRACFGFGADRPVLFSEVTYSFYPVWCAFFGIPFQAIAPEDGFRVPAGRYSAPNGGVVLCNPNAPTGIGEGEDYVRAVLAANPGSVVIVDEAYADFASYSALPLVGEYPNLLVARTFSKSRSLAGARIGYVVGSERAVGAVLAVKDSFNSYPMDAAAIAVGLASLADDAYYKETIAKVVRTRGRTAGALRGLGFTVPDSEANFLFMGCGSGARARALYAFLREGGIIVRHFDRPRTEGCLRVSIGTDAEMDAFIARVAEFAQKA